MSRGLVRGGDPPVLPAASSTATTSPHNPLPTSTAEATPPSPRPRPRRQPLPLVLQPHPRRRPVPLVTRPHHLSRLQCRSSRTRRISSKAKRTTTRRRDRSHLILTREGCCNVASGLQLPWAECGRGNAIQTTTISMPMHGTVRRGKKCDAKRATALKTCLKKEVLPQKGSTGKLPRHLAWRRRLEGGRANE